MLLINNHHYRNGYYGNIHYDNTKILFFVLTPKRNAGIFLTCLIHSRLKELC